MTDAKGTAAGGDDSADDNGGSRSGGVGGGGGGLQHLHAISEVLPSGNTVAKSETTAVTNLNSDTTAPGAQFTCFTSTRVPILTQQVLSRT